MIEEFETDFEKEVENTIEKLLDNLNNKSRGYEFTLQELFNNNVKWNKLDLEIRKEVGARFLYTDDVSDGIITPLSKNEKGQLVYRLN